MRFIVIALLAVCVLSGCKQRAESVENRKAGEYLDGKILKDAEGCAYMVTYEPPVYVRLRWVPEVSAESCTHTPIDAS